MRSLNLMRDLVPAALLALAVVLSACAAASISAAQIYGSWRITEVLCSGCGGPVLTLKGKVIEIGKDRILNPAGDDCDASPGFRFVKETDSRLALSGPGRGWAKAIRDAVAAHPKVFYGFVACGGINYMQMVLVSPGSAYYFVEGDAALALRRVTDPSVAKE
jgi:hypothetical protein